MSPPRTPTLSLPWWPGSGGVSPACPVVRVHPGHRSGTNIPGATPTPFATAARSPHVPQNTPGGRSSEETPRLARARGESDGNPIPRAAGQGGRGRTWARRCPLPQGLGGQDGVKVSGTGPGTGSRAPRSPAAAGKPRRAAGMLPPFLRASHVRDKHPLPALISSRGGRGAQGAQRGEKQKKTKTTKKPTSQKSLERKTHFLRQKKKIKSGLIKANFTGERRERAKHNVLEISFARLCPRKQDEGSSAVSAGARRGGGAGRGARGGRHGYRLSR